MPGASDCERGPRDSDEHAYVRYESEPLRKNLQKTPAQSLPRSRASSEHRNDPTVTRRGASTTVTASPSHPRQSCDSLDLHAADGFLCRLPVNLHLASGPMHQTVNLPTPKNYTRDHPPTKLTGNALPPKGLRLFPLWGRIDYWGSGRQSPVGRAAGFVPPSANHPHRVARARRVCYHSAQHGNLLHMRV